MTTTTLTPEQQQLTQIASMLQSQQRAQVRLSLVGLLGLGAAGVAVWLIRRRR